MANKNINIAFRYDEREMPDIIDATKRQINRKLAKRIDNKTNIWLINYGGRIIFINNKNYNVYYPEQLYGIKQAIKQYNDNYGENDDINDKCILDTFFKGNKEFRTIYNYYLSHEDEINGNLLFI